jgi:hypothetical protein
MGTLPDGINGMKASVSAGNTAYNGTFPIMIVTPNTTWTYPLASNPGGSSSGTCEPVGTLISDDAHLALDFLMEIGPDGAFFLDYAAGAPGTFAWSYVDYSGGAHGAGGAEWHPADGDKAIFPPFNSVGPTDPLPGGMSWAVPYYAVNTHSGSLSALSWASTAGGTVTAATSSAHGIPLGGTYAIAINGTNPAGYQHGYTACTVIDTTHFTCPLASNPGVATYFGTYNTFNMAASPGGTPLTITTTGMINDNFKTGALPASPPPNWLGTDFPDAPASYPANMTSGINYMQAVGVTGISTMQTDLANRFNAMIAYFGLTRGTFFQTNPKFAIGSSY